MNEKIKKFSEQAIHYAASRPMPELKDRDLYLDNLFEKFAELIVRECVDICNQAILQNQDTLSKLGVDELAEKMVIHGSINQAQKLGKGIKQHFGVEE